MSYFSEASIVEYSYTQAYTCVCLHGCIFWEEYGKEDFVRQGRAFQSQKRVEVQYMFSFFSVPRGSSEVCIASARRLEIRIGASEAAAAAGIGIRETESEKRERSGRGRRAQS